MKITDNAKTVLKDILAENGADGLMVELQETCCGKSPVFALARFSEEDAPEEIDGIQVLIPEEAKDVVDNCVIELSDGELIVANSVCGCSDGCHGCH